MIVKVIEIIAIVLGIMFVLYSLAAIAKKGSSVYINKPDEQNPFEREYCFLSMECIWKKS